MRYEDVSFVVDLNDVVGDGDYLVISLEHTREHGRGKLAPEIEYLDEGDQVVIYSGDEGAELVATVVKEINWPEFAVRPDWATERRALDMNERVSLHGHDPNAVVRALLRTPASSSQRSR